MCSAIFNEAVAAGDGTFRTWIDPGPSTILKSSTRSQLLSTHWARTPVRPGIRSSSHVSGISLFTV